MAYWNNGGEAIDRAVGADWNVPAATPSLVPAFSEPQRHLPAYPRPRLPRCPEIDCVRHLIPPTVAALAELRAAEADVGADCVLLTWGLVSEETYVTALATSALLSSRSSILRASDAHCPASS
jgi:hypothetical protein